MNASLRRRLFLWLAGAIVAISAAMAGLSFVLAYQDANDLQDTLLKQVAGLLAAEAALPPTARFVPRDGEDAETHLVVRPLGAGGVDPDPRIDVLLPDDLPPGLRSIEANGVSWRVMVGRNAGGQRFGVAQRQTVRDEQAQSGAMLTLVPMLVLVPVLLLVVHLLLRQGFARLVSLSRELDEVDDGHLSALDPADVPQEVLPLVQAVNGLLRRLGATLELQRRLVADAAHELRTPVAATRVQADNLSHADLPDEARARLAILQGGLRRTSDLIEQLLSLARIQGAGAAAAPFALDAVIRSAVEQTLPFAESRGVDLGCPRLDAAVIVGDSLHAFALARNLVDNAVRYTPAGGSVDVSVEVDGADVVIVVEDTGPGIDAPQRERVFEPFFRILGSQQPGSGLGLAIVRSAAQALGGRVALAGRRDARSGLRVTYRQKRVAAVAPG